MGKRGRKNRYEKDVKPYLKEINEKVRQGVTEEQIADWLGICVASLNNYRNQHAEFAEALKKNKGADVLEALINAGIEAATGGFYTTTETTTETDKDGKTVTKTIEKQVYIPPNPALNKYYVNNYGQALGFTNDPAALNLARQRQAHIEKVDKAKNWDLNLDNYK